MRVELKADVDRHAVVLDRILQEILLAKRAQGLHEIGRIGQGLEPFGEFLPVPLGNARDQRFLAVEVNVKRSGADGSRAADVLHGRAMKAGVCNAAFGGIQNMRAPRVLGFRFELRH